MLRCVSAQYVCASNGDLSCVVRCPGSTTAGKESGSPAIVVTLQHGFTARHTSPKAVHDAYNSQADALGVKSG